MIAHLMCMGDFKRMLFGHKCTGLLSLSVCKHIFINYIPSWMVYLVALLSTRVGFFIFENLHTGTSIVTSVTVHTLR